MSSSFGTLFKITTFGESHGPCIGLVLDGLESNLELDWDFINSEMERRRPKKSFETSRIENDELTVVSGVKDNRSTGDSLCILIANKAHDDKAYEDQVFRPGHGDWVYSRRFENPNLLGGGRYSGRETASRVLGGAIAKLALKKKSIEIESRVVQVGSCEDPDLFEKVIEEAHNKGDSVGGFIELRSKGLPVGLGEPVFDKFQALVSHAVMSIGSVKSISFGQVDHSSGKVNNTLSSGGSLAGFTDGTDLLFKVGFKPTPSVTCVQTDKSGAAISLKGRFDSFLGYRLQSVVEAMTALSLLDMWYMRYGR